MEVTFTLHEADNLDEALRAALTTAGLDLTAKDATERGVAETSLARAEEAGNEENAQLWRNILTAINAGISPVELAVRQISQGISSLLHQAGLGKYDAQFTVSVAFNDDGSETTVEVARGEGPLIDFTPAPATGEVITLAPGAASLAPSANTPEVSA